MPNLRALALLALPLVAGCKQGINERCQLDTDCEDGARCVIPRESTPAEGGKCQPLGSTTFEDLARPADFTQPEEDLAKIDEAAPEDLSVEPDLATPPDLAVLDGGKGDLGRDLGPTDGGTDLRDMSRTDGK